ncbi:uncharacterized protein LOC132267199 isoform X2 [Cornus florida]|uniref:uncharacterized protein LOC132267199 isoform X2 n=1 Tax=Cornus florida TaxID=4283 RepID=UPI002899850F|nr:uncharacterized protein LOC132267199 isoform X2 [Cornus florida]
MAVNTCESQDAYSISVLPDEGTTNTQCESQLAFVTLLEVPNPFKSQLCLDAQMNCQNNDLKMENADAHSPCIVNIDIDKKNLETPKPKDEATEKLKTEGPLMRQISLQMGEKVMQLLMKYSPMLPKFITKDGATTERVHDTTKKEDGDGATTERIHDTPNNRLRKYKRSASFNSRKVVLVSSVLSSIGTIVLIYLTLRVRQIGDGSVHV